MHKIVEFQSVVLAAGKGSRLPDVGGTVSKCLLPVGPYPVLWYSLNMLEKIGLQETMIVVLDEDKSNILNALEKCPLKIKYDLIVIPSEEDWGTANSLQHISSRVTTDLLVVSGDLISSINLNEVLNLHRKHDAAITTLFFNNGPEEWIELPGLKTKVKPDRDLVGIDKETQRLVFLASASDFEENVTIPRILLKKFDSISMYSRLIDAHVYVMKNWVLNYLVESNKFTSLKGELVPHIIKKQLSRPNKQTEKKGTSEKHMDSDRDEVADALRDKAGLAALNGLVSRQEFDAVRGDFEKRIGSAYDKFNNQEIVWQKSIDEILRELSEKADFIQVVSLQESIKSYLEKFQSRINAMMEVVGEPRAAATSRKLHRDAACLSCTAPAHMELESTHKQMLPAFPSSRPMAVGAEVKGKPSDDGDHDHVCYPDLPVPHPIDPRTHHCHRYCGGSHTILNNSSSRQVKPFGVTVNSIGPPVNTAIGSDGKTYMVDDMHTKKPCIPCNLGIDYPCSKEYPVPEEPEPAHLEHLQRKSSEMIPPDYRETSVQLNEVHRVTAVSIPPTPPIMDD